MVKIRALGPGTNKSNVFYFLLTNGNTFSNEKDVFYINEELYKKLRKTKYKFKIEPHD